MEIIIRNFFRLLRAGIFGTQEQIEPMSAWKWNRIYQLAMLQHVAPQVREGIDRLSDQFFLQIPPQQMELWKKADGNMQIKISKPKLPNKLGEKRLSKIIDEEGGKSVTLTALYLIASTAHHLLNDGLFLHPLIALGCYIKQPEVYPIDNDKLCDWIHKLGLKSIAQLEATLLISYLGLTEEDIKFTTTGKRHDVSRITQELLQLQGTDKHEWQFSQGDDIFVHNNNTSAMFWQARRSAKYFRYSPRESISNFVSSFINSLTHVEE